MHDALNDKHSLYDGELLLAVQFSALILSGSCIGSMDLVLGAWILYWEHGHQKWS